MKLNLGALVSFCFILFASNASATMPLLTDQPKNPSDASCKEWAANQDEYAIEMWSIQEDGSKSRPSGLARLAATCQGYGAPEIVGFGSSPGFNEAYCRRHSDYKICQSVEGVVHQPMGCVVNDPTPTLLNYRTAPYGKILGVLDNGQGVSIEDTSTDAAGKPWVYITDRDGKALGWVYRSYILCR